MLVAILCLGLSAGCERAQDTSPTGGNIATAADSSPAVTGCPRPLTWAIQRTRPVTDPIRNVLSIDATGQLYWNGAQIDAGTLHQFLEQSNQMSPAPELEMRTDPRTPCDVTSRLIARVGSLVDCSVRCSFEVRPIDPAQLARAHARRTPETAEYGLTEENARSIWSTSVYSYAPGGGGPGGGLADHRLRIGGNGDQYVSLIWFRLPDQRRVGRAAISLEALGDEGRPIPMNLHEIVREWSWQGERLWWRNLPPTRPLGQLPAPPRSGRYEFDITEIYNAWASGTRSNFGIMLRPTETRGNYSTFYSTRAEGGRQPKLVLIFE